MSDTDLELLARYSRQHAEDAFTELVRRHLGLVYSAALRQVRLPQLAEEIAQSAFMDLARHAAKLKPDTILTAWLYQVARRTAIDVVRREASRQLREQTAAEMNVMNATADDWTQVEPLLDEAMHALDETDRAAVLLRYFENKSLRDVGAALGTTDNAAGKRINRAVERLREFFAKRGVTVGTSGLVAVISANAVQAAPVGLAATIAAAALSSTAIATTAVVAATKALTTLEKTIVTAVLVAFVAVTTYKAFRAIRPPKESTQAAARDATVERAKPSDNQKLPPLVRGGQPTTPVDQGLLRFRVRDEATGAAITNAKLFEGFATSSTGRPPDEVTDAQGEALLRPPLSVRSGWDYCIETVADGYVPKFVSWSERQHDQVGDLPREYTLKLAHGTNIGGRVVDSQNQPVQGARVVLSVSGVSVSGGAPGGSADRERLTLMGSYHSESTDAQGRWRCSHVPSRFGMIYYTVRHRDYLEATFVSNSPDAPDPQRLFSVKNVARVKEEDLLAANATMMLKPGLVVMGVVLDENGAAVTGAKITQDRFWGIPEYSVLSGPDGGFRLGNVTAQKLILTVQAEGYAPQDMIIDPRQPAEPTRFILNKGAVLLGRVTDESGQPIVGAGITVARAAPINNVRFQWKTETDEQGRFQWLTAPTTDTSYVVRAAGYENQDPILLKADGTEHPLLLPTSSQAGSVRVSGKVLDRGTHQPIPTFRVLLRTSQFPADWGPEFLAFPPREVVAHGSNGGFNFRLSSAAFSSVIEIQADGYWPVRFTNRHPIRSDQTLTLEVRPGSVMAGEVHTPDGQPAADAAVVLRSGGYLYVTSPRTFDLKSYDNPDVVQTDAAGRFAFQPRLDVRKIAIAHPSGFVQIAPEDLVRSPTIRLEPWGRVEGTLQVRGEANAARNIFLGPSTRYFAGPSNTLAVKARFDAKTDGDGHFVLEGVPPGEFLTARKDNLPELGPTPPSHGQVIQVRAGETTRVMLGGTGRVVVGGAALRHPSAKIDWQHNAHRLSFKLPTPTSPPMPQRPDFASDHAFSVSLSAWQASAQQYWNSPAGLAAQRSQHEYALLFDQDGRFRLNDVLPGTYELNIRVTDPQEKGFSRKKVLAQLLTTVVVPEAPDGASEEPVDLGTLLLESPGDQAAKGN